MSYRGLFNVDWNNRDTQDPRRKVEHHGDVVVKEDRCQPIPPPYASMVMEKRGDQLDHRSEFRIAVGGRAALSSSQYVRNVRSIKARS